MVRLAKAGERDVVAEFALGDDGFGFQCIRGLAVLSAVDLEAIVGEAEAVDYPVGGDDGVFDIFDELVGWVGLCAGMMRGRSTYLYVREHDRRRLLAYTFINNVEVVHVRYTINNGINLSLK